MTLLTEIPGTPQERFLYMTKRLQLLEDRIALHEKTVTTNIEIVAQISKDVREIIDLMNGMRVGMRAISGISSVVKWAAGLLVAVSTLYSFYHVARHGTLPIVLPK